MKDFLLFSSVGDNYDKAFKSWFDLPERRNYDIILIYYGNNLDRLDELRKYGDIVKQHSGSKFQNLVNFYQDLSMNQYQYTWLVDDDLAMDSSNINRMFEFVNSKKYSLAQPSMDPKGRNTYYFNLNKFHQPKEIIYHTNFVEIGAPILKKEYLKNTYIFLKYCDNKLISWGIDYIWQKYFFKKNNYFQVLLNFMVYNPRAGEKKDNTRECLKMGDNDKRKEEYEKALVKLGLTPVSYPRIYFKEDLINNKKIIVNPFNILGLNRRLK